MDILLSFESGNDTIFRWIASYTIPVELLLGLAAPGAAMARLRKEYVRDRRTAGLRLQLTPSERIELEFRAASVGMSLSKFCRIILLSDLKKPAPSATYNGSHAKLVLPIATLSFFTDCCA